MRHQIIGKNSGKTRQEQNARKKMSDRHANAELTQTSKQTDKQTEKENKQTERSVKTRYIIFSPLGGFVFP